MNYILRFSIVTIIIELVLIAYFIVCINQVSTKYQPRPFYIGAVIPDTNWNNTSDTNSDTKLILNINKLTGDLINGDTHDTKGDTSWYHGQMIPMIPPISN